MVRGKWLEELFVLERVSCLKGIFNDKQKYYFSASAISQGLQSADTCKLTFIFVCTQLD